VIASDEELAKEMIDFVGEVSFFVHTPQGYYFAVKYYDVTDSFTCPPKEVVLRISIALKNPLSSARFEPANLGPMASTLIITPPRMTSFNVILYESQF
jgi:hypothetical protein